MGLTVAMTLRWSDDDHYDLFVSKSTLTLLRFSPLHIILKNMYTYLHTRCWVLVYTLWWWLCKNNIVEGRQDKKQCTYGFRFWESKQSCRMPCAGRVEKESYSPFALALVSLKAKTSYKMASDKLKSSKRVTDRQEQRERPNWTNYTIGQWYIFTLLLL